MENYAEYISVDPEIRFGKPCIRNTRITVGDILGWLSSGMSYEDIYRDFPEINKEHILAALTYAANREKAIKTIRHNEASL